MNDHSLPSLTKKSVITFTIAIATSLYWFLAQVINVYQFPFIGAIYELLWIGMVIILFGLPVFSFVYWIKNKFSHRSLYLYSFIISTATILVLITQFD